MNLRLRVTCLMGGFLALLIGIGVWGVWSTVRVQELAVTEHGQISDAELRATTAEVGLRKQVEEWKDVLLRGHDEDVLKGHWAAFVRHERSTRKQVEDLRNLLPQESVAAGLAAKFLRDHQEMGDVYRDALVVFRIGGEGAQLRGDGLVEGRATDVGLVLREIVRVLSEERVLMEKTRHDIAFRRTATTMVAILVTSLTAFVVFAVALHRWMDLSILSMGRPKKEVEEKAAGGGAVKFKAPTNGAKDKLDLAPHAWKRVLVVVRNPEDRGRLATQIRGWDCEVVEVDSVSGVARCLELDGHRTGGPLMDAVLVGEDLRGVDGFALARLLRSEVSTAGIPLILWGGRGHTKGTDGLFDLVVSKTIAWGDFKEQVVGLLKWEEGRNGEQGPSFDIGREFVRSRDVRVLAVEDEAMNRKYMRLMLEKAGYQVVLAEDGKEALQAMASQDYDVVLMDCGLPVMDGFEATPRIRVLQPGAGGPVVIGVTARTDDAAHVKCFDAGMNACVSKPVKLEYLCLVIEEELAKRDVAVELEAAG